MPKSSIATILEVQRAVNSLDRKGKMAILNDLLKQDLTPKPKKAAVTYKEGGE